MTKFTITRVHGYKEGDKLRATVFEDRWWMLLWYFIIRNSEWKIQTRVKNYTVISIDSGTTFTVK